MCEGEAAYLISFAFIYCALNVSDFRLLDLGRASVGSKEDLQTNINKFELCGLTHAYHVRISITKKSKNEKFINDTCKVDFKMEM